MIALVNRARIVVAVVAAIVLAFCVAVSILGPITVEALHLPSAISTVATLVGGLVAIAVVLCTIHIAERPLRAQLRQLARETGDVFMLVTLDPVWLPVGSGRGGPVGLGLLSAGRRGIRLTSLDRTEILLDAAWPDIAELQENRAPQPIIEVTVHRLGAATHWWFEVRPRIHSGGNPWRPGLGIRRSTTELVARLHSVRANAALVAGSGAAGDD